MGGKLEVPDGSCTTCNGKFGKAEATIKDATVELLNLLGIKNREGVVPGAKLENVRIRGMDDLKNLPAYMNGKGEVVLQDYVRDVTTDDGKKIRSGFFVTKKGGDTFLERESKKGGKLIHREAPKEIVIEANYKQGIMFAFWLETRKVAAKIALAAIAYECGVNFACSPQFDAVRKIIDETDIKALPVRMFANQNITDAWQRTPYLHSVMCYLSAGMKKGWAIVTLFGSLSYLVEVTPQCTDRYSTQFSIFFDAESKTRVQRIVLADEMTLIGHVLSPATTFEDRHAVDAQWFPVIRGFASGEGTIVERIQDVQKPKEQ
jgi:hypothetical protein